MKQSAYNNQYKSVSDNIALLAIGKTVNNYYFSHMYKQYSITTPQYNYWQGDVYCDGHTYGIRWGAVNGANTTCTNATYYIKNAQTHYEKGGRRQYDAHEINVYTIVQ